MAKFNENSKLGAILKDEQAKEIISKYLGANVLKHPMIPMVKIFSLKYALRYKNQTEFDPAIIEKMVQEILEIV